MRRTQILLEERQHDALVSWARATDRSISELVRMAVGSLLGNKSARGERASVTAMRGLATDKGGPSGRDHDRALYGPRI
jgi:hypothetical protein